MTEDVGKMLKNVGKMLDHVGRCCGDAYSGVPNNRTYVRSCSEKIFPLCTQLLETLYAQSREAKFFKIFDFIKNERLFCLKS